MAEALQSVDSSKLVAVHVALSLLAAPFTSPVYNFPLFLYGNYALSHHDSAEPLNLFQNLLGASILLDLVWLIRGHDQSVVLTALITVNLLLKIPTFLSVVNSLRSRGVSGFPALGSGGLTQVQNVWSMPGAFSGRDGYQNVDDDLEGAQTPPAAPPKPSGNLQSPPAPQQSQGGYQTL